MELIILKKKIQNRMLVIRQAEDHYQKIGYQSTGKNVK